MPSVVVWEHYLVYATSLKIADKVMAQLRVKLPEMDTEEGTFLSNRYVYPDSIMDIWLIELIDLFRLPKIMSLVRLQGIIQAVDRDMVVFSGGSSFGGGGGGTRSVKI